MEFGEITAHIFARMRKRRPLIHHITNFVVMNDTANLTLAIGASPIMAHSCNEIEDIIKIADATVINIGTLGTEWVDSMNLAAGYGNKKGIPIILDPVGAGATAYRSDVVTKILDRNKITVLKGNLGEISSLAGMGGKVSGVDSLGGGDPESVVKESCNIFKTVTAVTGSFDYVCNGTDLYIIRNDSSFLPKITGSGCMVASVIASFLTVEKDYALATASALALYSMAGEMAQEQGVRGPSDFRNKLIDTIYNLKDKDIIQNIKVEKRQL